jgi:hypothetical protein
MTILMCGNSHVEDLERRLRHEEKEAHSEEADSEGQLDDDRTPACNFFKQVNTRP